MKTKLIASLIVIAVTVSAIPLSEIIRVQTAKLEYERVEYQVYCEWGASQTPVRQCVKMKKNLKASAQTLLDCIAGESGFGRDFEKEKKLANGILKDLK